MIISRCKKTWELWRDPGLSYTLKKAWNKAGFKYPTYISFPFEAVTKRLLLSAAIVMSFFFGVDVGRQTTIDERKVTCVLQKNEKLVATHQFPDGSILCEFGIAYGAALKRRPAQ